MATLPYINMTDADTVEEILLAGAAAGHAAACRVGSIDRIAAPGTLIATGDLHDNPIHLLKLLEAAHLTGEGPDPANPPCHLMLHELIHGDNLMSGMDLSYRVLTRVADLKRRFPEHVHVLLANHELSQIAGAGIIKDGVRVVEAFNKGVEYVFGSQTDRINLAIAEFVRSMPLALRCVTPKGDILCAHSLPTAAMMAKFDTSVLSRDLNEDDYQPRTGSAYIMVWGRKYDSELLEDLVERWGVNLFILGHEKCDNGVTIVPPNAVVLNSDHARGVYLPIDLEHPPRAEAAAAQVVPLAL
jgi:hypothetical protein